MAKTIYDGDSQQSKLRIHMVVRQFQYDVCLSFAGENREYVRKVARELSSNGLRVFYDEYEAENLWGKNLYEHLRYIYSKAARYCVIFISRYYVEKIWTRREHQSAQERALNEAHEYILPVRMDESELPGLLNTISYMRSDAISAKSLASKIGTKILPSILIELQEAADYFPTQVDRVLFKFPSGKDNAKIIQLVAQDFFLAFMRLSRTERKVVSLLFAHGCPAELPDYVHIDFDLLRRVTRLPPKRLRLILGEMKSVGFSAKFRKFGGAEDVKFKWTSVIPEAEDYFGSATDFSSVPKAIFQVLITSYCEQHFVEMASKANFMGLSSKTHVDLGHCCTAIT